ncbi:hypothetical protein ARMSODRAFT_961615 [Armillaria solidipes]|uniref:Uncharacterized protein n=1 Tax=Armillaria solidipes TaxID=1076256 RepID=A0A2H3B1Q4_9AGAR|nr:hypothetical protein ARMSODRAFT_961615 [Armillaria solidipes]
MIRLVSCHGASAHLSGFGWCVLSPSCIFHPLLCLCIVFYSKSLCYSHATC